jgi:hypothetical protein
MATDLDKLATQMQKSFPASQPNKFPDPPPEPKPQEGMSTGMRKILGIR